MEDFRKDSKQAQRTVDLGRTGAKVDVTKSPLSIAAFLHVPKKQSERYSVEEQQAKPMEAAAHAALDSTGGHPKKNV